MSTVTPKTGARAHPGALFGRLSGRVLVPGDEGFEAEIAPFNQAIAHDPLVVVGAAGAGDVSGAVRFAADHGLAVAVQATGHGAVTPATGMLISTRRMDSVHIDPAARTATVSAGARWRSVINAAAQHGLAPLNGSSSSVGAVGYTLGGGLPVLGRAFGFAADHVRSLDVVTANGQLQTADATNHPDLFWGMRGGKHNLGIVTSMTFDLMPVDRLFGGGIYWPGEHAPALLDTYRTWCQTLPDTTCTSLALLRLPPLPDIPQPLRGTFTVHLRVAHLGPAEEGERLLTPMRAAAPAMIDTVADMPYTAIDSIHQDPDHPVPAYERGVLLPDLTPAAVATLMEVAGPGANPPVLLVDIRHLGGALARQPRIPNATGGREAQFCVMVLGLLMPAIAEVAPGGVESVIDVLRPFSDQTFLNFHGVPGDDADRARAWPAPIHQRLRELKRTYDPQSVFRDYGHTLAVR